MYFCPKIKEEQSKQVHIHTHSYASHNTNTETFYSFFRCQIRCIHSYAHLGCFDIPMIFFFGICTLGGSLGVNIYIYIYICIYTMCRYVWDMPKQKPKTSFFPLLSTFCLSLSLYTSFSSTHSCTYTFCHSYV